MTVAGSDSGGGAGVQADLKTFAAMGVHGTSVLTCLTAQNPDGVRGVEAVSARFLRAQLESVFEGFPIVAAKTGMLYSRPLIDEVVRFWSEPGRPPLVVDPVMVATSGARLLKSGAERRLLDGLLPLAALVTPNLDEAAILSGREIRTVEGVRWAAREIHSRWGVAALVKGGHLRGGEEALDVFFDGRREWLLVARRVRGVSTHGTGCTYSAAIAAGLACGLTLGKAVEQAKEFITQAIASSRRVGRHFVLDSMWACGSGGARK